MQQDTQAHSSPSRGNEHQVSGRSLHAEASSGSPDLVQQLAILAGYERGSVQPVHDPGSSSDEDVFAHGYALDEP
jgi:hypothetical protein